MKDPWIFSTSSLNAKHSFNSHENRSTKAARRKLINFTSKRTRRNSTFQLEYSGSRSESLRLVEKKSISLKDNWFPRRIFREKLINQHSMKFSIRWREQCSIRRGDKIFLSNWLSILSCIYKRRGIEASKIQGKESCFRTL